MAIEKPFKQEFFNSRRLSIIDAGCGDGRFFEMLCATSGIILEKERYDAFGVDSDAHRLARLPLRETKIKPIHAELEKIPLPSEFADIIIANSTIEHCSRPLSVLKELHRISKMDGLLLLTVPSIHFERLLLGSRLLRSFSQNASIKYSSWKSARINHHEYLSLDDWTDRLAKHGFIVTSASPLASSTVVATGDALQWFRDIGIGGSRYSLNPEKNWAISVTARTAAAFQTHMATFLFRLDQPTMKECGAYALVCRKA